MEYIETLQENLGGFDFSLHKRNDYLIKSNIMQAHHFTKTGTTIVGMLYDGGVMIAADTRATAGDIIADKNTVKIRQLAPNIYASGAGTAADLQHVSKKLKSELELQRLNTNRENRVFSSVARLT